MSVDNPIHLLIFSSVIVFLPVLIGAASAYVKVSIVLGTLRNALGQQQIPGPLITSFLSLTLSLLIMWPTVYPMYQTAKELQDAPEHTAEQLREIIQPWRTFMERQANEEVIQAFLISQCDSTTCRQEQLSVTQLPLSLLLPIFLVSEMEEAFEIALVLLIPFLLIDILVSILLAGLGMFMVSPVMISFPLKLLMLVYSGFLTELTTALVQSYAG